MKSLPPELLIVLFVLAAVLVQLLLRSRPGRQPPPEPAPDETRLEVPEPAWWSAQAPPPVRSAPSVPEIRFGRSAAATVPIPPARSRFARKSLMGSRRDLQNAIVIAAIVGPCRALAPPAWRG
jgi:hypothetical protein